MDGSWCAKRPTRAPDSSRKSWFMHETTNIFASLISPHEISCKMWWNRPEPVARITRGGIAIFNPISAIQFEPWLGLWSGVVILKHYSHGNALPHQFDAVLVGMYSNMISKLQIWRWWRWQIIQFFFFFFISEGNSEMCVSLLISAVLFVCVCVQFAHW